MLTDSRVTESVASSPFNYRQNCLLYLPKVPSRQKAAAYYDELAKEIAALLDASQGHALALFTSYAAMSAVKERLPGHGLRYPLFTMGGVSSHDIQDGILEPDNPLFKKKCRKLDASRAMYRVNHRSWWKEELPSEEEYQTARANLDRAGGFLQQNADGGVRGTPPSAL